jgi:hypothetical protein
MDDLRSLEIRDHPAQSCMEQEIVRHHVYEQGPFPDLGFIPDFVAGRMADVSHLNTADPVAFLYCTATC